MQGKQLKSFIFTCPKCGELSEVKVPKEYMIFSREEYNRRMKEYMKERRIKKQIERSQS